MRSVLGAMALVLALAGGAAAHDGVDHGSAAEATRHAEAAAPPSLPFPGRIGGAYALIDQTGAPRTERDANGQPRLLFFGYAACPAMCGVALPRMARAVDLLAEHGVTVRPVMITVDPATDTPQAMGAALARIHPRFLGLTGAEPALAAARAAFQVESQRVSETPEGAPIYAHGTFVYLMDAEGGFLTLMPPILGPERMAEIALDYLRPK